MEKLFYQQTIQNSKVTIIQKHHHNVDYTTVADQSGQLE